MDNLQIQYSDVTPLIDFSKFVNSELYGVKTQRIISMAKGDIPPHKGQDREDYREYLFNEAMNFVDPFLRNWNGWTWRWYVNEFLQRIGLKPF